MTTKRFVDKSVQFKRNIHNKKGKHILKYSFTSYVVIVLLTKRLVFLTALYWWGLHSCLRIIYFGLSELFLLSTITCTSNLARAVFFLNYYFCTSPSFFSNSRRSCFREKLKRKHGDKKDSGVCFCH